MCQSDDDRGDGHHDRHRGRDTTRRPGHFEGLLDGLTAEERRRSQGPFNFARIRRPIATIGRLTAWRT